MKSESKTMLSILSLSTVTGITTVITGIIPQLKETFPNVPTTMIELLITIANFSALVTLLLNPILTERFSLKKVVIFGLLASALAGILPLFTTSFALIMVSRIILGLGVGLFSPHAISLIAHSYKGELRARLLGYQTGLSALGNAILLGVASLLVIFNWQNVFWLYALLIVIAILVKKFVPEPSIKSDKNLTKSVQLPHRQWLLIVLAFITYLLIWGVQLKLPSYFEGRQFGNAQVLNLTLAAMNIGGFLAGISFGQLHRKLHKYTLTLGYAGAALSVLILWTTSNSTVAILAAIFFNFIYSYTGPYLIFTSNNGLAESQVNTLSSYLTVATIISAFFAPLVWNLVGQIGPQSVTNNVLLWIMIVLAILAIMTIFFNRSKKSKSMN